MHKVRFFEDKQKLNILCLGAHPDDIEIGCGGTILRLIEEVPEAQFYWAVFSGDEKRGKEAFNSANEILKKVKGKTIDVQDFRESYFPFVGGQIKDYFEKLAKKFLPDIVFTHCGRDAHQDHRLISSLTWNTFRDHFILEYEVPKYDGDLRTPNLYVYLHESHVERKIRFLCDLFQTQKKKQWFDEETFRSILRIRGVESNSPSKYAEAFYCRKIVF
ncbi:MAG: PIG-L deacetylase family protein [Candidatus Bathyarchaeia archaeon]